MSLGWWVVYAVGLAAHLIGTAVPVLHADPAARSSFQWGHGAPGRRDLPWMVLSVVGVMTLMVTALQGAHGLLGVGALVGAGVALGALTEALLVRRHNRRLERATAVISGG